MDFEIQKYVFIYDEYKDTRTYDEFVPSENYDDATASYHINSMTSKINNGDDIIFGGLVSLGNNNSKRVYSKFEIFRIEEDNTEPDCSYLKNCVEPPEDIPIKCPPGMMRLPEKIRNPTTFSEKQKQREFLLKYNITGKCPVCVPCPEDTYSNETNEMETCTLCPDGTKTHNKTGQTKCFRDNFYLEMKKIPITDDTELEINKNMSNYLSQKNDLDKMERKIFNINGDIQEILTKTSF